MTTLKQLTDQVVEDKKVQKALTSYVEGGRHLLCVTIFAGKSVLSSSPEIAERLEKKPELMAALMELFEDKSLVTAKSEETDEKPEVKMNRPLILPPLFAPFKNEKKGWTKAMVAEQLNLYLNLLGYGVGGDKSFVAGTKNKDTSKPAWFPDSISFEDYSHPSKAKLRENEEIIESLLNYYGINVHNHVVEGVHQKKIKVARKSNIRVDKVLSVPGEEDPDDFDFMDDVKRDQVAVGTSRALARTNAMKKEVTSAGTKRKSEDRPKSEYELIREKNIAEKREMKKALGLEK